MHILFTHIFNGFLINEIVENAQPFLSSRQTVFSFNNWCIYFVFKFAHHEMDEWQWKPVLRINVNAYVMQTQRTTEYSDFFQCHKYPELNFRHDHWKPSGLLFESASEMSKQPQILIFKIIQNRRFTHRSMFYGSEVSDNGNRIWRLAAILDFSNVQMTFKKCINDYRNEFHITKLPKTYPLNIFRCCLVWKLVHVITQNPIWCLAAILDLGNVKITSEMNSTYPNYVK